MNPDVVSWRPSRTAVSHSARPPSSKENQMYVYIRSEPTLWTVGFYAPDGKWNPESDHGTSDEAAKRVAWLNGNQG